MTLPRESLLALLGHILDAPAHAQTEALGQLLEAVGASLVARVHELKKEIAVAQQVAALHATEQSDLNSKLATALLQRDQAEAKVIALLRVEDERDAALALVTEAKRTKEAPTDISVRMYAQAWAREIEALNAATNALGKAWDLLDRIAKGEPVAEGNIATTAAELDRVLTADKTRRSR